MTSNSNNTAIMRVITIMFLVSSQVYCKSSISITAFLIQKKSIYSRSVIKSLMDLKTWKVSNNKKWNCLSTINNQNDQKFASSSAESTEFNLEMNEDEANVNVNVQTPWSYENQQQPFKKKGGVNKSRFRQHVNPLARKFQMPTDMINEQWPCDGTYIDPTLPLHVDIGCGKGGFLLSLAEQSKNETSKEKRNYLGLEIRPSVALFAKQRVMNRNLNGIIDFVGCNANVDLDRILYQYTKSNGKDDGSGGRIELISIQFPDPHFKKAHQKRRVVTPELVHILAKYIPEGGEIFIQSDIKDVLDNMRLTIREEGCEFFTDLVNDVDEYMEFNPTGFPTEREVSVLNQNLPVYRTVFRRSEAKYN